MLRFLFADMQLLSFKIFFCPWIFFCLLWLLYHIEQYFWEFFYLS